MAKQWTSEDFLSLTQDLGVGIIDSIRDNRKELLKIAKEVGGDDLMKQMGENITSLNRSSIFREQADWLGIIGDIMDSAEYLDLANQFQTGKIDSRQLAEFMYDKICDKIIFNTIGKYFPFFKIPAVQVVLKKGGILVGDWLNKGMDRFIPMIDHFAQKKGWDKWIINEANKYPELVNALRKLSGKPPIVASIDTNKLPSTPVPAVMYDPKNPPASTGSSSPMVYKPRVPSQATIENFLLDKSGKTSCSIDDFVTAAENMRKI